MPKYRSYFTFHFSTQIKFHASGAPSLFCIHIRTPSEHLTQFVPTKSLQQKEQHKVSNTSRDVLAASYSYIYTFVFLAGSNFSEFSERPKLSRPIPEYLNDYMY